MTIEKPKMIPLKITWAGVLPYLLAVIADSKNPEHVQEAKNDLARMARIADQHESNKEQKP